MFSLTAWGTDPLRNKLLASERDTLFVLNMEGKMLASLPAPGNLRHTEPPQGTPVRFSGGHPYYASLQLDRQQSLLFIYDAQNQLAYSETLDSSCASLLPISNADGKQDLLVGCDGKVWKYTKD
jgi:hypothetical protein